MWRSGLLSLAVHCFWSPAAPTLPTNLALRPVRPGESGELSAADKPKSQQSRPQQSISSTVQSRGDPRAQEVVSDLEAPWGLVPLKDGSFLISERDTRKIVRVEMALRQIVRTIDEADPAGEGGLLGLAMTPNEKTVFGYYTAADDNRIVSMSWDGRELGAPKVILRGIPKGFIHNGGRMVIGPDGYLYVGTGESGIEGWHRTRTHSAGRSSNCDSTADPRQATRSTMRSSATAIATSKGSPSMMTTACGPASSGSKPGTS